MKIHCITFQPRKLDRSLGGSPRVASALSGMYLEPLGTPARTHPVTGAGLSAFKPVLQPF